MLWDVKLLGGLVRASLRRGRQVASLDLCFGWLVLSNPYISVPIPIFQSRFESVIYVLIHYWLFTWLGAQLKGLRFVQEYQMESDLTPTSSKVFVPSSYLILCLLWRHLDQYTCFAASLRGLYAVFCASKDEPKRVLQGRPNISHLRSNLALKLKDNHNIQIRSTMLKWFIQSMFCFAIASCFPVWCIF